MGAALGHPLRHDSPLCAAEAGFQGARLGHDTAAGIDGVLLGQGRNRDGRDSQADEHPCDLGEAHDDY